MHHRLLLVVIALLALAAPAARAAEAPIFPYRTLKSTLPNGLTAILIPMDSPGLVSYVSVVRTGSRDEVEPGKSGFAHFFEHMMFRGTKKYPAAAYNEIVTRIGAATNASTSDDVTRFYFNIAAEDLEQVVEIESDRFQNLAYSEPAFQTEAGAVYGEYRKNVAAPGAMLAEKLRETAYDRHTYKHTTMGFERDIQSMPKQYDYSLSFFARFYRPENVVLLIAGDIDPKTVVPLLQKYYGGWRPGYVAPAVPAEPVQTAERSVAIPYPGRTLPILTLAYKGDAFDVNNRDLLAALLLRELAFGSSGELYRKLVLTERKVQSLSASFPLSRDQPLFQISATVNKPEDLDQVRDEIYRTLEDFKTKPVDAGRLRDLKRRNKYSFLMSLETPDAVTSRLTSFVALTGDVAAVEAYYAQSDTITPEDLMRAAAKYFVPEHRTVAVLKGTQ